MKQVTLWHSARNYWPCVTVFYWRGIFTSIIKKPPIKMCLNRNMTSVCRTFHYFNRSSLFLANISQVYSRYWFSFVGADNSSTGDRYRVWSDRNGHCGTSCRTLTDINNLAYCLSGV